MNTVSSDEVAIRSAEAVDLSGVTAIYNHYVRTSNVTFDTRAFATAERETWFAQFASTGPHRLLVAAREQVVLGWACSTRLRPKPAYDRSVETTVYLRPDAIGLGLGTALYDRLLHVLAGEAVHRAYAVIALPNPTSVAFHERYGYRHVGTFHEVGYKFDRYWDVAWYERAL